MAQLQRRTILIGKARRITLDELYRLSKLESRLEVHHQLSAVDESSASSSSSSATSCTSYIETALATLALTESSIASAAGSTPENKKLLSEEATIASLGLLAITIAQGRVMRGDCAADIASALAELVNVIVTTDKKSLLPRLPIDSSAYITIINDLLSSSSSSSSSSATLPKLEDGPYISRVIHLARVSIMLVRARTLTSKSTCDAISALTVERLGEYLSFDLYSPINYDELRPHKGCIECAAVLRACLAGSTRVNNNSSSSKKNSIVVGGNGSNGSDIAQQQQHDVVAAIRHTKTIPQYHGPARESIIAACKTMELEINCSSGSVYEELDEAVSAMAIVSTLTGIVTLVHGIDARTGGGGGGVDGGGSGGVQTSSSSSSPLGLAGLATELETSVADLQRSLEYEVKLGCEYIASELSKREEELKIKEAEKAAKRGGVASAVPTTTTTTTDGGVDEFAGMTETQKAKVLKKRAEKEAKAAAKLKAKEEKSAGGQAALSSIFGAGTALIYPLLSSSSASEIDITNGNGFSGGILSNTMLLSELEKIVDGLLSGGMQRKPKVPKGTRDYLPEQMLIRDEAFTIIRRVFKRHGAVEIDTPVFELKETLTGKYGEDSKLIYDLADQGGETLALRYDLTVPFARFLAVNAVGNIKRYHIGKVYRRDQPALSRGRYREFYQCDFDIAGTYGRMVPDSECLVVACEILDALPIGNFGIKLNHRRLLDAILDICGVPADKFRSICSAVDKLDKEPWSEVRREMVEEKGLAGDVADKIGEFVILKGEPWEMYNSLMDAKKFGEHTGALAAMEDLRICFDYLEAMDKLRFISFDLSLARGLDYYTGVIYEAVCMNGNTQVGSIGGGGRYDNLVSMFQEAGKVTPCVGVSVGIERVFTLMEERLRLEQGGSIKQPNVAVLIASAGENLLRERMKLAKLLWDANISAEFSQQENPKLKFEIANALDRQIPFIVIAGEEEAKEGKCKVKDLKARTEETVNVSELVKTLRGKGVVPVGCEFAMELLNSEKRS